MEIWKFIKEKIHQDKSVALLTIIESKGSSPGKASFKMCVADDGEMSGSIGGGTAEYKMVELAKRKMTEKNFTPFIKRLVHDADAEDDKSGMICSGEQTQAFIFLDKLDLPLVESIINCKEEGKSSVLKISQKGIELVPNLNIETKQFSKIDSLENWEYQELIGLKDTVYIFGGGHVSLEFSKIMRMLNFRVLVFDNRDALSTLDKNIYAHKKEIVDYKNSGQYIVESNNSYVVIMTVAHKHDLTVLKQMLRKKVRYLGMMGSKSKIGTIHELLEEAGFSKKEYSKVDMPIGLPIKSKTPAEIAVSIAARIVEVRNS